MLVTVGWIMDIYLDVTAYTQVITFPKWGIVTDVRDVVFKAREHEIIGGWGVTISVPVGFCDMLD